MDINALFGFDKGNRFFDFCGIGLGLGEGVSHGFRLVFSDSGLYILRYVDKDGAGAAGSCDPECLPYFIGKLVYVVDEIVVLRYRKCYSGNIDLLKAVAAYHRLGDVSGYGDHRNGVQHGGSDAGHKIRRAGAGGREAYADLAGSPRISVSRVSRALFVGGYVVRYAVGICIKSVVNIEYRASGIAENIGYAKLNKSLDYDLCAC